MKYGRVKRRKETDEQIKATTKRNENDKKVDPNENDVILQEGKIDIGHKAGFEHRRLATAAEAENLTNEEWKAVNNNPKIYQEEDRSLNRSHKHEDKSPGGLKANVRSMIDPDTDIVDKEGNVLIQGEKRYSRQEDTAEGAFFMSENKNASTKGGKGSMGAVGSLGAIGDSIGPLTQALELVDNLGISTDGLVEGLGMFQMATQMVTIAQTALNAVMAMNPYVLIAMAVVALIAGLIYLWNTNEGFREALIAAWEAISSAFSACWDAIVNFFTVTLPEVLTSVITWFSELPGKIWEFLVNIVTSVATWITDMTAKAMEVIPGFIESVVTFFKELPSKIWEFLVNIVTSIATWITDMTAKAMEVIPGFIESVVAFFTELPGKIWSFLTNIVTDISNLATGLISKAGEVLPGVISSITSYFSELPGKLLDMGRQVIEGFWNGISNAGEWLRQKISGFFGGVVDGIKNFFGIHSPSTLFRDDIGAMLSEGVAEGITDNGDAITEAFSSTIDDLTNVALDAKDTIQSSYDDISMASVDGLQNEGLLSTDNITSFAGEPQSKEIALTDSAILSAELAAIPEKEKTVIDYLREMLAASGQELQEGYFNIGGKSAAAFGEGFSAELERIFVNAMNQAVAFKEQMITTITSGAELAVQKANSIISNTTNNNSYNYTISGNTNSIHDQIAALNRHNTLTKFRTAT